MDHPSVLWRIKHIGLAWYTRRFTRFSAMLDYDPGAAEAMRRVAEVEVGSGRADCQGADKISATGTMRRSGWGLTYFIGLLLPDEAQLVIEAELALQD